MAKPLGDSGTSWWHTTATLVERNDEAKIKDCKEDIDTLLVFAGLFSAVTTTFLVDSYKSLNQDPAEATLLILQRISEQLNGFTLGTNNVTSTIPPFPTPPPFEPSRPSLATNAAWFGSLMLSLMAASYGMLIKQWLREFLASDYISPRARLRVRCFRFPGLAKWKVFEIVAVLPLLLQLALGFFFVGLCFFASTIHPVLQRITVPLVGIWAFFLLGATLAPAFSSRCPYKTTFLKGTMKSVRRLIQAFLYPSIMKPLNFLEWWFRRMGIETRFMLHSIRRRHAARARREEEEDVANRDTQDLYILSVVDAAYVDDNFLCAALQDPSFHLESITNDGAQIVPFVIQILAHRDCPLEKPKRLLDINAISVDVWNIVMDLLVNCLTGVPVSGSDDGHAPPRWKMWMSDAILILFSNTAHPLSIPANTIIARYLETDTGDVMKVLAGGIIGNEDDDAYFLSHVVNRLWDSLSGSVHDNVQRLHILEQSINSSQRPFLRMRAEKIQVCLLAKLANFITNEELKAFLLRHPQSWCDEAFLHRIVFLAAERHLQSGDISIVESLYPLLEAIETRLCTLTAITDCFVRGANTHIAPLGQLNSDYPQWLRDVLNILLPDTHVQHPHGTEFTDPNFLISVSDSLSLPRQYTESLGLGVGSWAVSRCGHVRADAWDSYHQWADRRVHIAKRTRSLPLDRVNFVSHPVVLNVLRYLLERCAQSLSQTLVKTFHGVEDTDSHLLITEIEASIRQVAVLQMVRCHLSGRTSSVLEGLGPLLHWEQTCKACLAGIVDGLNTVLNSNIRTVHSSISSDGNDWLSWFQGSGIIGKLLPHFPDLPQPPLSLVLSKCFESHFTEFATKFAKFASDSDPDYSESDLDFNRTLNCPCFDDALLGLSKDNMFNYTRTLLDMPNHSPYMKLQGDRVLLRFAEKASAVHHMSLVQTLAIVIDEVMKENSFTSSPTIICLILRTIRYQLNQDNVPLSNLRSALDLSALDGESWWLISQWIAAFIQPQLTAMGKSVEGMSQVQSRKTSFVDDAVVILLSRCPHRLHEDAYVMLGRDEFVQLLEGMGEIAKDVHGDLMETRRGRLREWLDSAYGGGSGSIR
ncbi:unnamed protein product [Somion occarium]|uniref:DUF6535 domain-containing protein n=1 Tax=Somion occarium TaxID=3059160 RepID=A0ABP1CNU6_9APHY